MSILASRRKAIEVVDMVQDIRTEMPCTGTRKLYFILKPELEIHNIGRDRLFDIFHANHMLVQPKRSYHITTNSYHRFRKHKNLIADIKPTRLEEVWVSDITYIGTRKEHMYLFLVTDAYSKKIMGFDLSDSLNNQGAINALKIANG